MAGIDDTFHCSHFACTLAIKHCLRRQRETWSSATRVARGPNTGVRVETAKPKHPFCASGTCPQGNEHAAAFTQFTHQQRDPRTAPRMDIVQAVEEKTMPKNKPGQGVPCPECGSPSKHKKGCSKPPRASAAAAPAERRPARPSPAPARRAAPGPEGMSVEELLELRAGINQELARRRDKAQAELRALDAALVEAAA